MESTTPINATCPECRGPLSAIAETREMRCLVGHTYSPFSLLQAHYETQERALWSAVVALEETKQLVEALAPDYSAASLERLRQQAETKLQQAKAVRRVLEDLEPFRPEEEH